MSFKENMKKLKSRRYLFALIALLVAVLSVALGLTFGKGNVAYADSATPKTNYRTYVENYKVDLEVSTDRVINVTEIITVYYYGNAGFFRDIPVNAGEQIRDIQVSRYLPDRDTYTNVYYDVFTEDFDFITVEFDDNNTKYNETRTYLFTYTYILTKATDEGDNIIAFNPFGLGMEKDIYDAEITVKLPSSYTGGKCFFGKAGSENNYSFTELRENDCVYLTAFIPYIAPHNGVSFYFEFEDGVLTTHFDFTPYWFVLGGVAILLLIVAVKLAFFNKLKIIPVVNFEAPEKMDPLIMGKLIDNKVNSEDITSMIFYWADKGYIKINIQDKNDPVLIRIRQHLPADAPVYEVKLYNELFSRGDTVKTGDLKYRFYTTVDKVTKMVNSRAKGLYNSVSIGVSILFAILGALLMGATPLALAMTQVSSRYIIIAPFISFVPLLFVYAITETIKYNTLKYNRNKKLLFALAIVGVCALFTVFYVLFVPSSILGTVAKIALCVVGCAIVVSSVLIISRTKDYTQKLNDIVGFKNFITLTEKDRLEKMLETNPQFYYHVLPYAQVLGVSDKWEEKFKDLTVEPPQWATSSSLNTIVEFHFLNSLIRQSASKMSSSMISRPSSSSSGGFGGFGGGGHVGGGHGGGGMRFK